MGFFDSEIVQQEARNLFQDYQSLMELGADYGKFDREGKKLFIEKMEEMMDRYRIFMKRFELSDDFMAQMTMKQLQTQIGNFGITPQQMFDQMNMTLERMKSELKWVSRLLDYQLKWLFWFCHYYYGADINIRCFERRDRFPDCCPRSVDII